MNPRLRRPLPWGCLLRLNLPLYLLIPVACAFTYVVSALMLKRASALGVGVWRISFLANWTMFLVFLPWWLTQTGSSHAWTDYWQPAVNALLFLAGQMFIFYALQSGDVSVTTPVMGSKVLMVALLSHLLRAGEVPGLYAGCDRARVDLNAASRRSVRGRSREEIT